MRTHALPVTQSPAFLRPATQVNANVDVNGGAGREFVRVCVCLFCLRDVALAIPQQLYRRLSSSA